MLFTLKMYINGIALSLNISMVIMAVIRHSFRTKLLKKNRANDQSLEEENTRKHKIRETYWIKKLRMVTPYGLGNNCEVIGWANQYKDTDIFARLFNRNPPLNGRPRGCWGRRKYNKNHVNLLISVGF